MQRKGETEMTREEAIRILDPETTGEALAEIEYYGGFSGRAAAVQAVSDACVLAVDALREQEQRRWIPVTERLPENIANRVFVVCERSNGVFYAHYEKPFWINLETDKPFISTVTHWMPLPAPSKEGAEG